MTPMEDFSPRSMHRHNLHQKFTLWRSENKGVAAVEFALILPFALLMYFGSAELTKGILVNRKVTVATRSLADLLGQSFATITDAQILAMFTAAQSVMGKDAAGASAGNLKMTVSSIEFKLRAGSTTIYDAKTVWSSTTTNNPKRPCNVVLTPDASTNLTPDITKVPIGFYSGAGTILVADVTYTYPSPFSIDTAFYKSPATMTFNRAYFQTPRNTSAVVYSGGNGTICP